MSASSRLPLAAALLLVWGSASAVSKAELESRIEQLERKVDSRGLIDMQQQISALQRELQQLRGEIEVQTHTLEGLKKRQRDLYLDIDRRLHRLEAGGVQGAAGVAAPANAGASPAIAPGAPAGVAPVVPATNAAQAAPPAATLNPAAERKAYDAALELLKEGRYSDAAGAFQGFLKDYPGSSYSDNAQYWLGEVYYVTREFKAALSEFDKVLKQHPGSSKSADAKLKMGYIQYELKDWAQARGLLEDVVKSYPGTTSARLAGERLERMKREGR